MGAEPPYIYQRPSKYDHTEQTGKAFNPKGVTHASWAPRPPPLKQEGPLIDAREFNKHPDSYFIVPYGNLKWRPMSKNTKTKVKWVRGSQLFFRILELLGALGLLFCVICIRPIGTSLDWIIRVAPAVCTLHTIYAIYHLSRRSKDRTPASTASYMIFAAIMDAGILPFLGFTAFMSNQQQQLEALSAGGRWTTLFGTVFATDKVVNATYLISVVDGALHITSFIVSLYLAVLFRQISKLPPDMNPLEDNLTSRRSHKRNKSSMSFATESTSPSNRNSTQSLMHESRKVPFTHTRGNSSVTLSNPSSPLATSPGNRASQPQRMTYDGSPRASQTDFRNSMPPPGCDLPSPRSSHADMRRSPDRVSRRSPGGASSFYTAPSPSASRPVSSTAGHVKRNSMYHSAPAEDNWFAKGDDAGDLDDLDAAGPDDSGLHPPELQHLRHSREYTPELVLSPEVRLPMPQKAGYEFLDESPRQSAGTNSRRGTTARAGATPADFVATDFSKSSPRPLGLHPPGKMGLQASAAKSTPPATRTPVRTPAYTPSPATDAEGAGAGDAANPYRQPGRERRALREVEPNSNAAANSPATFDELLFAAEQRARGDEHRAFLDSPDKHPGGISGGGKGRFYGSLRGVMGGRKKAGRAVSTGLDDELVPPTAGLRGRDVSGKIAEEGRA